jgi:hypothetical protein
MGGGERGKENHKLEGEKGAKRIISWRLQKKLCTLQDSLPHGMLWACSMSME